MRKCDVRQLHLVTYENGLRMQQTLVEMRQRNEIEDQLLLLEHPPVITMGRGGQPKNMLSSAEELHRDGIRYFETGRGGDITYHGPGQLVGYPILHLGEGNRDVRKYVTKLEEVLIRTVAHYGITATRVDGKRGIWVGNEKIAAIGVRIARWVTSHGFALNVNTRLEHFRHITPCGLNGSGVTSIQKLVGAPVPPEEVRQLVAGHFGALFERELTPRADTIRLAKVVAHDRKLVLLLHRRPERGDFWQPITGTIDSEESELETARREVLEETGQPAEPRDCALQQSFIIESQYLASRYARPIFASEVCFFASLDSSVPVRLDRQEHDAYGWFTFPEACEKIRWSDDREAIERLEKTLAREADEAGTAVEA
jgi:lipoyl(octanoyl) transferase